MIPTKTMKLKRFIILVMMLIVSILLNITTFSIQQSNSKRIIKPQLLETGFFHGREVKSRTGEQWLGLFDSKTEEVLRETTIVVKKAYDPIVDESENIKTGKDVSVNDKEDPVFLVRGIDALKPGPIKTAFKRKGGMLLNSSNTITIKLDDKIYTLSVKSQKAKKDDTLLYSDSKLVLSINSQSQILYSFIDEKYNELPKDLTKEEFDNLDFGDGSWRLYWAGDLDDDGNLDLYLDASNHYNVNHRRLFLSSKALPNKLVKEIVSLVTTGC